MTTLTIHNSNR